MENETSENENSTNEEVVEVEEEVTEEPTEEPAQEEEVSIEVEEPVEEEDNSEAEELRVKVEQLEKENKTLKIQKAKNKQKKAEPKAKSEKTESLTRDEAILFARGLSEEEVEKAKSIAKIEEQSVIEAVDSDFFTIWKDKNDKAKETQETQLGASKGSARALRRKTFSDSDLTAEEHKELFNKKMGR